MDMEYSTLLFDFSDNVAQITLNRPEVANAVNLEMASDLMRAAIRCSEDPAVRAVLLTGSGRIFCSGGDLKSFAAQGENLPRYVKEVTTYLHVAISHLTRMDAPLVAAVNGFAAGAGTSLAFAADILVAAESAGFTMAYTRAGLTPDGSVTYFLPRLVGTKRALELTLTNRVLSAQEAFNWGIVSKVVPDAKLLMEAGNLATQLAAGPTRALAASKRLLLDSWSGTLETQMEHESRAIADMARTADAVEGIAAFLEKRAARFTGH